MIVPVSDMRSHGGMVCSGIAYERWLSCERTHDSGFMIAEWCCREACYVECRVLLVRVSSCDRRVQKVFFGVVGGNAQRSWQVLVECCSRLPRVCLVESISR